MSIREKRLIVKVMPREMIDVGLGLSVRAVREAGMFNVLIIGCEIGRAHV